jgi:predicted NBD/HSP70 family sugar kinase
MPSNPRLRRPAKGQAQEDVRRHNLGTLLGHLHLSGPLSRAELTARMGLNRSTIAALVGELGTLGAVREERPAGTQSGAGRPSLVVRPNVEVQVIAADIGVDRVDVALVGLGGRVVARRHRSRVEGPRSPAAVVDQLVHLIQDIRSDPAGQAGRVVGFGVSVPGVIRQTDGCVRFAPNLGWVDEPFGELLADGVDVPVHVGNDADLGVLAEHLRGAARGYDDVVFIAGEVGVGGGLIVGGHTLLGAGGYAGEVGHMTVRPQGRACRCGARGCWETEIGSSAIGRALGLPDASTADVVLALREPHAHVVGALDDVAHFLGLGLASIVNLVNPRLVIIGGVLREIFPLAGDVVRASLDAAALAAPAEQVLLRVPELGGDAVLIGAAELAWQSLLDDPAGTLGRAGLDTDRLAGASA